LIVTFADDTEVHPCELVTVNVYVPGGIDEIVVLIPVPVVVLPPGVRVRVHEPAAGKPFNTTLPVETVHVGCVIVPIDGAAGVAGWAFMAIFPDDGDTHPAVLVTVYE
jgi:hypothetical protein